MIYKYRSFVLITLIISFTACSSDKGKITANTPVAPPPPTSVEAFVTNLSSIGEKIELPGTVISGNSTELHPEISGRLTYLNIREGQNVSKGTLLAKIYDGDLQAKLNKLKVQLKVQEEKVKRYDELYKVNGVSTQEYDLIKLETSNLLADIRLVQSDIIRTEIRAPFAGRLGLKMVSDGAYVSPQTTLTTIRSTGDLQVEFTLPEKFSADLGIGSTVNFNIERNPKTYSAKIFARESGISESDRSLKLRAKIIGKTDEIIPGNFVKINISFAPDSQAIMIPSQAIIPLAKGKQVALSKNGKAEFINVETGIRTEKMVQVTEGLSAGDTVITTGLMKLKDGSKIKVSKTISNN